MSIKRKPMTVADIGAPLEPEVPAPAEDVSAEAGIISRSGRHPSIKQLTAYLPIPVYRQLREVAFVEEVRMHALLMEGLARVFEARGLAHIKGLPQVEANKAKG